jgi:3-oxoacyl-[acyl-carrier-protein] synthase II
MFVSTRRAPDFSHSYDCPTSVPSVPPWSSSSYERESAKLPDALQYEVYRSRHARASSDGPVRCLFGLSARDKLANSHPTTPPKSLPAVNLTSPAPLPVFDVVITGLGIVSPIGVGADAVWASLLAGKSGVRPVPDLVAACHPIPIAGEVVDFDAKEYVKPRKALKVMSRETQIGFAAAEMAWADAGLDAATLDPERLGVTCGSNMFCPELPELEPGCRVSDAGGGRFDFDRWGNVGLREVPPLWLLKYLPNMLPAHISITHDARGPSNAIVAGETSGLLAIIEAAEAIARGHADVMVTGGASSTIAMMDVMWHGMARLSRRVDEPHRASRPFDADRDGWVGAEGGAMFVLESRAHAEARGAEPIARLRGFGRRHEPTGNQHIATGQSIRQAIAACLAMAAADPADVGFVSAHGMSTEIDDRIEAAAIRATLGDVPVTAPKSFVGNIGAASGALELAMSLLGLEHGQIPPTLNYDTPDPKCPVNIVTRPTAVATPSVLAISHRTTGQAVTLLAERT